MAASGAYEPPASFVRPLESIGNAASVPSLLIANKWLASTRLVNWVYSKASDEPRSRLRQASILFFIPPGFGGSPLPKHKDFLGAPAERCPIRTDALWRRTLHADGGAVRRVYPTEYRAAERHLGRSTRKLDLNMDSPNKHEKLASVLGAYFPPARWRGTRAALSITTLRNYVPATGEVRVLVVSHTRGSAFANPQGRTPPWSFEESLSIFQPMRFDFGPCGVPERWTTSPLSGTLMRGIMFGSGKVC